MPHPFDRMHSVPDYEHLLAVVEDVDAIEVFNPRIAIPAYNEEAVRFAGKYRIVGGAGSDSHVAQGLGSVRIRMRDFDGPEEFLASLADADIVGRPSSLYYAQVQALKFLQTRATPPAARRAARRAADPPRDLRAQSLMQGQGEPPGTAKPVGGMPATDDEIREKYLERAIRELNHFTRDLQACAACPRGSLMPILGSGHPQADVFLLKYAPTASEIEEGVAFYGRSGTALMKSLKRLEIDPLAVYGTLCVKCPVAGHGAGRAGVRRAARRGARDRAAADRRRDGARGARDAQRARAPARPAGRAAAGRDPAAHAVDRGALRAEHRRGAGRGVGAKRAFWTAFRRLGDWYADFPPYYRAGGVSGGGAADRIEVLRRSSGRRSDWHRRTSVSGLDRASPS